MEASADLVFAAHHQLSSLFGLPYNLPERTRLHCADFSGL
jgi:hypothetical protein